MTKEGVESVYPPVMEDVARRIIAAELSLNDVRSNAGDPFVWVGCEIAVLQIRKICELLLLGSTVAHSQEGKAALNLKEWRPKNAFGQLDRINDHPLPMPVKVELNGRGLGQHHLVPLSQPVNFDVINRIYGVCGDLLHAPSAHQIFRQALPSFDVDLLERWVSGFKTIAMGHVLMLPKRELILLCRWSGSVKDSPTISMMRAQDESSMDIASYPPFELLP